jgi:hypothetical protein
MANYCRAVTKSPRGTTAFLLLHSICWYFHCVPFASSCPFGTCTAFLSLPSVCSVLVLRSFRFLLYVRYLHCVPFSSFCMFGTCTVFLFLPSVCSVLSLSSFHFILPVARSISCSLSSLLLVAIFFHFCSCLVCV